jgi:hypothetical protein
MAEPNGQKLSIKTGFGEITAGGTTVFIVIAMLVMAGAMLWEHYKRKGEHESIECAINLNLFLQTKPRGDFNWHEIPTEYWRCLPSSIAQKMKP